MKWFDQLPSNVRNILGHGFETAVTIVTFGLSKRLAHLFLSDSQALQYIDYIEDFVIVGLLAMFGCIVLYKTGKHAWEHVTKTVVFVF
jgi:hypothetical protein